MFCDEYIFRRQLITTKQHPKGIWKALKSLTKTIKSNKNTELEKEDGASETDTH